ncbi:Sensory box/GGDEF [Bacillus thuringiensis serovar tochigiensis BGSC 4Y1]|nr:Sensory box/GGDEF [Bacillus thuringiensis serovar tochigiensis BGSC 4Y1]
MVTPIFTIEFYIFHKSDVNNLFLSIGEVFLSFIFPVLDLLLLLLGVSLIIRPTVFTAKSKLYMFIIILIGLAITDYLYFYFQDQISHSLIILLRCLYRVFLLLIAIVAAMPNIIFSKINYFNISPIFGKKLLNIFPYLALTILVGFSFKEQTSSFILITGNRIAFVLVLIRLIIAQMENQYLTKKLKIFNNQLEQKVSQRTANFIQKSNDLIKNQEKFKLLYDYHPDPILTLDLKGIVLNINQAGSMLIGKTSVELIGKDCFSIFLDDNRTGLESALKRVEKCKSTTIQLSVKSNDEKNLSNCYVTIVPIRIEGQPFGSYVMVKDITKLKKQQAEINYLAFHDTVTGIGNRVFFQKELEKFIQRAQENKDKFGVIYIDLNRFKNINDTLGHSIGDKVLKEIANRFRTCLSPKQPLARIGGMSLQFWYKVILKHSC